MSDQAEKLAQTATYTPSGGSGSSINGVFDNGDGLVDLGGRVGVTANDPQFVCRTSDVSSAAEGDALVTGSVNYTIRDVIDDGTGMTTLMLETD
uniref:Uncharacterized protein n=1 Tax=uncultured nuHF2 cluster bacterium HF0500_39O04 TaxID=723590 RepID=E7C6A3_9BACT|nr:hypothetical protein [uncultured nuHF2 cluster bacterium HF0500_39O04]